MLAGDCIARQHNRDCWEPEEKGWKRSEGKKLPRVLGYLCKRKCFVKNAINYKHEKNVRRRTRMNGWNVSHSNNIFLKGSFKLRVPKVTYFVSLISTDQSKFFRLGLLGSSRDDPHSLLSLLSRCHIWRQSYCGDATRILVTDIIIASSLGIRCGGSPNKRRPNVGGASTCWIFSRP